MERVLGDAAAAAVLLSSGGRLVRHSFVMVLDLSTVVSAPPVAEGFSVSPMTAQRVSEYGEVVSLAYPPGHLDYEPSDADPQLAARATLKVMNGQTMGPFMAPASLHLADADDRIVGQILINDRMAAGALAAGPFVTDLCIIPAVAGRGLGAALLGETIDRLIDLGRPTLALVVSAGNPAQRVYERIGFDVALESWQIETET